jgi:pimeloyl-ACP methyl ester carboxylesterase
MQHLLLLHGAIGSKEQLQDLANLMERDYNVHLLNFAGHGGKSIPDTSFSIQSFSQEVLDYIQQHHIEQTDIFGYSMGGYVGMYIAKYFKQRIRKLITLATKFYWDKETAAKEIKMIDAATIQQKVPAFADELSKRHAPNDWTTVLKKSAEMLLNLGNDNVLKTGDYTDITTQCLMMLGDRDKMVTLDETVNVYKQLSNAQLCILPSTHHPIERVDKHLLAFLVQRFLRS